MGYHDDFRGILNWQEPKLLIERPTSWSHIDAAALPTVFTTVEVALNELANLQARYSGAQVMLTTQLIFS